MRSLLLLAFLCLAASVPAQELRMPLWPEGKVSNYRASGEVEKRDTGTSVRITLVQTPEMDVYLPPKRVATGQAVVICPGGGYSFLSYDWEGSAPARWLSSKGIAAIVLKYRLPNAKSNITPHLSPLADAQRAIRLTRHHAERWNIRKDRVGIMGFSAGGHLASTAGTHFDTGRLGSADPIERQSSRPDFMVLVYPVITMSKPVMHKGSRDNLIGAQADTTLARIYSNELQVRPNTPPTFLLHATDDKTVPVENSLYFYQALRDNGVNASLHIFPKGGHGFGLAPNSGALEKWTDLCLEWMRGLNL